jgi:hypothetical protein
VVTNLCLSELARVTLVAQTQLIGSPNVDQDSTITCNLFLYSLVANSFSFLFFFDETTDARTKQYLNHSSFSLHVSSRSRAPSRYTIKKIYKNSLLLKINPGAILLVHEKMKKINIQQHIRCKQEQKEKPNHTNPGSGTIGRLPRNCKLNQITKWQVLYTNKFLGRVKRKLIQWI